LNPDTGKLNWYAATHLTGNVCPSVIHQGGIVYVFGGYRSFGSVAIHAGGEGDVTNSRVLWTSRITSYVATPLLHEGYLYWVDDKGVAHCMVAKTGEEVYRERLSGLRAGGRPVYASPVLANGKLFIVSRLSGTCVLAAEPEFKQIGRNQFSSDNSDFNATPPISDGQLFLRSNRYVYCIEGK